ncbi:MAG TPA: molybdopterin dinucleotide binding domain-containing protein, partial [Actinomycetes bacterium]|nr:molybdopterin dinucleotide binding domain-containing protein [Actinomycetes bacterium]
TFTDWEGRVQATHRAVPVGGAAQEIWDLADQLAVRLGVDLGLGRPGKVAEELERFRRRPATLATPATTPSPEPHPGRAGTSPAAVGAPSGRVAAGDPGGEPLSTAPEEHDAEGLDLVTYPLLLDAASMLARADDLNRETPGAFVELHPDDAARLGLADGDRAEVDFGEDRTARLPVRVAPTVAPGCAFVPANQPDLALGALLGPAPGLRVTVTAVEEAAA